MPYVPLCFPFPMHFSQSSFILTYLKQKRTKYLKHALYITYKYPEGVLFKKIHSQEEQKRMNIEIRSSTTVPLRESVSSLCGRGHANLLEGGAPSQPEPEWQWVRRDMFLGGLEPEDFLCRQPEIETLSTA